MLTYADVCPRMLTYAYIAGLACPENIGGRSMRVVLGCVDCYRASAFDLAYVSMRQHTSAYVVIGCVDCYRASAFDLADVSIRQQQTEGDMLSKDNTYVVVCDVRQHTSAYVSIRQHTSAYVSIRQHTTC
jgi:hypothetical protein